jgi:hypothetical protein
MFHDTKKKIMYDGFRVFGNMLFLGLLCDDVHYHILLVSI